MRFRWIALFIVGILFLVGTAYLVNVAIGNGALPLPGKDILTSDERQWLNQHPGLRLAPDPNFPPIESFNEKGEYVGMVADLFTLIQDRLDYHFTIVHLKTWNDVLLAAQNGEIDGITAAQITPERSRYLLYTRPILDIPNVIITRQDTSGTLSFEKMDGMTVAITSSNALHEYIQTNFPRIVLDPVADDLTALQEVSFGRADATVVNQAIASYLIEKGGISNLRVAGDSGKSNPLAIGTRKDLPILNHILEKGLAAVSEQERTNITNKWVNLGTPSFFLNPQFWLLVAAVLVGLLAVASFVAVWIGSLRRLVGTRTGELNKELGERKRAEERIQRQLQRLSALRTIDTAISASLDLRVVLNILLEQVTSQLHADAAAVLLLNPHTQVLEYAAGRGFHNHNLEHARVPLGGIGAGVVALERRIVTIPDLSMAVNFQRAEEFRAEGFVSYFAAPLIARGEVKGVLEILLDSPFTADEEWLEFLETMAGQAAIALTNAELFEDLQRSNSQMFYAYEATIEGWSRALDLRDHETEGHSQRVAALTVKMAGAVHVPDEDLPHLRRGALLHDIGKVGIPDHILLKPGPLTSEEWEIMKKHPTYAFRLLSPIEFLRKALDIPYCHHERWNGSGYPRGLQGEQIPLAGRIFAIVDVWDALRSDRPYRPAWASEQIYEYLRTNAGILFDPHLVEVFLKIVKE